MTHVSHTRPRRPLILVTGAGRSGTSTEAGVLCKLGFHAPEPHFKPNESNPRGFFESKWPVKFHNTILKRANVVLTDSRPHAIGWVQDVLTSSDEATLNAWLADLGRHDRVVVKDPRAMWLPHLWKSAGLANGFEVVYLTMLRHPTEVIGSRKTNYSETRPWMSTWEFGVWNLCGWINGNLLVEQRTRGDRRAVVSDPQLLEDWRSAVGKAGEALGIAIHDNLDPTVPHPVDDFVDEGLRRHATGWDAWEMPPTLVEIAEAVYGSMLRLSLDPQDPEAMARMDEVGARYAELYRQSSAIAYDTEASAVRRAVARDRQKAVAAQTAPGPLPSKPRSFRARIADRLTQLRTYAGTGDKGSQST